MKCEWVININLPSLWCESSNVNLQSKTGYNKLVLLFPKEVSLKAADQRWSTQFYAE